MMTMKLSKHQSYIFCKVPRRCKPRDKSQMKARNPPPPMNIGQLVVSPSYYHFLFSTPLTSWPLTALDGVMFRYIEPLIEKVPVGGLILTNGITNANLFSNFTIFLIYGSLLLNRE